MMLDPKAQDVGIGGMVFLSALWLFLKYRPWKSNGKHFATAGEQSPEYWQEKLRLAVKEGIDDEFAKRDERIRKIVREELTRRSSEG